MLKWVAVVIEFVGLSMIEIELDFPVSSVRLKTTFEELFNEAGSGQIPPPHRP